MIIHVDRIPAKAPGLEVERPVRYQTVTILGNVGVDLVDCVTEHLNDYGCDAVAGLAAVEVVDF